MRTFLNHAPVTVALASASVIVWLVTVFQSGSMTNSTLGSPLADAMMFWGPYVMSSDYGILRAITASFLHLDAAHVTMNVVMLLLVGWFTERHLGHGVFVLTYLTGGIASYATVLWAAPLTPTAGASGALYALMVIMVAVLARQGQDLRAPLVLVAVNVGYTLLVPGVSLWGASRRSAPWAAARLACDVTEPRASLGHGDRRIHALGHCVRLAVHRSPHLVIHRGELRCRDHFTLSPHMLHMWHSPWLIHKSCPQCG